MTFRPLRTAGATLASSAVLLATLSACGDGQRVAPEPLPTRSPSPTASPTATSPTTIPPGTTPPAWLGTRVLKKNKRGFVTPRQTPAELVERTFTLPDTVEALPGTAFASKTVNPAPAEVIARSTWSPRCPVAATDLAWVRVAFWGFDDQRHTGELLVAADQAKNVVRAFHGLWDIRFPIEEMRITTRAENRAKPTGDGNNTSAFNCRRQRGATTWSEHAYGLAVDVNPFQNPYSTGAGRDRIVLPELATSYLSRVYPRPGMIMPGSAAVRAFSQVGWRWGGHWKDVKDLQHFSLRNR